jgi:transglutaminase-like putative cysteine protease
MKILSLIMTGLLAITAKSTLSLAAEPPGASAAFTSEDPVVLKARGLMDAGKFKQAEILARAKDAKASAETIRARTEFLDILHRVRLEYSLDAAGLLAKVKKIIPDASAQEVERWAAESNARFKIIDGQKRFFSREPQNIFLFSDEAKKRRAKANNAPTEPKFQLTNHLAAIVAAAEQTGAVEVMPVKHHVTHTVTIPGNNPAIKAGSLVRVWLPFAQEYRQQRDVKLLSASPEPKLIAPSAIEGNPVSGGAQRTVYFEQKVSDPTKPLEFKEIFEYTSLAYYPKLDETQVQALPKNWSGASLGERLPHIAFTPEIRKQVAKITGKEKNPLVNARKIFRWVSANIPWNAEDEYCIIPSFAIKGFNARRGDCGVQNTVFITMCRIAGIPARWQSGFETKPGESWGMHDWAEIYIAPWGWLPADASYGVKKSDDPRIADFYCGHQDSYRLIVNLDWGRELFPPKRSLRSEPADFQRGEVEVDGKNLYYDEWDSKTELDRELITDDGSKIR